MKRFLLHNWIRINRYILRKKYLKIFSGPLKGYWWDTSSSYAYLLNEYEDPEVLKQFFSWLEKDSVFYDIGANGGYYALLAQQYISEGIIYSFEPIPANIQKFENHLKKNRKLFNRKVINLEPIALSDKAGKIIFSDEGGIEGNTYIQDAHRFKNSKKKIEVESDSIDGLIEKGYKVPDIIKIDVEGAEFDVLQGAVNTLTAYKPNIIIATHDCHLPGVKDNCVLFLQSLGYELYHTGSFNKKLPGHDDYIAINKNKTETAPQ